MAKAPTAAAIKAAKARALDALHLNATANEAKRGYESIVKELSLQYARGEIPALEVVFNGKPYDCREFTDAANEVDVSKLVAEIGAPAALTIVSATQKAVETHGGKALLARVLKSVEKPPEFKIKRRAA